MLSIHGTELWVALALTVVAAVVGYALSETDRRRLGRTPWGLPSLVWAVFWFMSLLLGIILYLIAHRAEVRRAAQTPMTTVDAYGRPVAGMPAQRVSSDDFPAYPRPAHGGATRPPGPFAAPPPAPPQPPALPAANRADATPPSWQPDPSGRYHYRWWSGSEWTSYVASSGHVVIDTSPDQRTGPY